jgi:hypothetical protein
MRTNGEKQTAAKQINTGIQALCVAQLRLLAE